MLRRISTCFAERTTLEAERSVESLVGALRALQLSHFSLTTSTVISQAPQNFHAENEHHNATLLHLSALRWHGKPHYGAIAATSQFQSPKREFSVLESQHGRPSMTAGISSAAGTMYTEGLAGNISARSSVNKEEIARFEKVATTWWDVKGPYAGLHAMNPVRVGFIRSALCDHFGKDSNIAKPLKGIRILDVGCGGGLLSEPLARLGAEVTGVDATDENIKVAALHSVQDEATASIEYVSGTAEQLVEEGRSFDAVMALEVIEHVDGPEDFVKSLGALCAPNGAVVMSTLNRTLRSYALGIVAAEYVGGLVPVGTHSWEKFVTPEEMALLLRRAGLQMDQLAGMVANPLTMEWKLNADRAVNYIAFATRL